MLEYISLREKNSLFFLRTYIEKVLNDSGIYYCFEEFFKIQTKVSFHKLKELFSSFIISNTKINRRLECNRIFTKVLNPLAYFYNAQGCEKGRLSKKIITYDMLMYNRNNFRDINKPKDITRQDFLATNPITINKAYYRYQSSKAKRYLRIFNDQNRFGKTEHLDGCNEAPQEAIHMHHIFSEAIYPEISFYLENIIALTPTQHYTYAHPKGNTQEIDEQYQHLLLLSKADRIRENLTQNQVDKIYEFSNFLFVLNVGFADAEIMKIANMDFDSIVNVINVHYSK